jgi:hypothetical protein
MRKITLFAFATFLLASCSVSRPVPTHTTFADDGLLAREAQNVPSAITQSLFADNEATISEENIQKILDGTLTLPEKLRVAVVRLESRQRQARPMFWSTNEAFLRGRQSHLDLLSEKMKNSQRVERVSIVPEILISSNPTFVTIREAAVRTQADVVAIFSTHSDIYTRSRFFSSDDIKAFATTQFILLDVRTGLIPFSTIITKEYQSQRIREIDFDVSEARSRIINEAVLLSMNEIGVQLVEFFNTEVR